MIPNKTGHKVISNIEGKRVAMGFDPTAMRHLMGLLTDAYTDPLMAIIREYTSNAVESNFAAGNDSPVQVTLPTKDSPTFIVADQGVGLDLAGIEKYFGLYGASTKRDSNDFTGSMGIGCKSGLAYADQITIVATKDEVRTTVLFTRNEDGGGDMVLVSEEDVPFVPNGVEVLIPANPKDITAPSYSSRETFAVKAAKLFRFWPEGSVLVNGKAPKRLSGGVKITDDITAYNYEDDNGPGRDHIVCGTVPYEHKLDRPEKVRLVAQVPIGSVDFTAAREGLRDTGITRKTLANVEETFKTEARNVVQALIEKAPTKYDALKIAHKNNWLVEFAKAGYTYKGEALPTEFKYPQVAYKDFDGNTKFRAVYLRLLKEWKIGKKGKKGEESYAEGASDEAEKVNLGRAIKAVWVTGYPNSNWNALNRKRLTAFLSDKKAKGELPQDIDVKHAVITPREQVPSSEWIDPSVVFSWKEEVKKFRMSGPKSSRPRVTGSYPVWTNIGGENTVLATDIDQEAPIFWADKGEYVTSHRHRYPNIDEAYPNAQVVHLTSNRKAKFLRDYPEAKNVVETLRDLATKWWNGLSDEEERTIRYDGSPGLDTDLFNEEDYELILDPGLRDSIVLNERNRKFPTPLLAYVPEDLYRERTWEEQNEDEENGIDYEERYPLLDAVLPRRLNDEAKSHALAYVNATYAQFIQTQRKEQS